MSVDRPLIDAARVNFSGMSEESFDNLSEDNIGDIRVFTVRARVKGFSSVDMAESGVRRSASLKILKVMEGVTKKVLEDDDQQPSLYDETEDDGDEIADDGDDVAAELEDAADAVEDPDDEPSNVTKLANPSFSSQD
ncbi:hypothetical protein CH263_13365 [Rhodococcus sp. 06-1059B-a]|nr:hypothetical protein [Rhodococcus sp. 06-1059B-a]OZD65127.1 hypothetical protein CH263_13365 [Rhodococcus sp. 06-1059B-a]